MDPFQLVSEITELEERNISVRDRLQLSNRAHVVMPYHKIADGLRESSNKNVKIGTTKRGIGPTYADKANRVGIRAGDFLKLERLETRFRKQAERYNEQFEAQNAEALDIDATWTELKQAAEFLAPMIEDTIVSVNAEMKSGKNILLEGAQGFWLDIDYGTYPFVTSSNTSVGGVCTGAGIAPSKVSDVWGVVKAYTTRVGEGPFPTELHGQEGEDLRAAGNEFGATTGRPRRCGWFDAIACRYAVMVSGVSKLAVTKLDVLDELDEIKVCIAYEIDGERTTEFPADIDDLDKIVPVYQSFAGWKSSTCDCRSWEDLPAKAQEYLTFLSEQIEAPLGIISTGPNRAETFFV